MKISRDVVRTTASIVAAAATTLLTSTAAAGISSPHGYSDLLDRLGSDAPDGAGIPVAQVEVPDGEGDYGPNFTAGQYNGITFYEQSGPTGTSTHGHNVGRRYYGGASISKGIDEVYLYEVNHWLLSGYLRTGTGSLPFATPGGIKVFNHSWVGNGSTNAVNNDVLRRADFVMNRDDILMVVGVNNVGGQNFPLMSHIFNGLSVGLAPPEEHQFGNTLPGMDTPGRLKPEIVTVEVRTSYATPYVGGGVTLMTETARTMAGRGSTAERGEVIKAVLLAGAQKTDGWTNNPTLSGPDRGRTSQPIDNVVGVGALDVNRAHLMLTAGEQDGIAAVPDAVNIQHVGWDLAPIDTGDSAFYRFRLRDEADSINIIATWHRRVESNFITWSIADIELHLWRVDGNDQLLPLTGDDGIGVFTAGNVVSESAIDNIEHLHLEGLAACEYVLEVRRVDSLSTSGPWDVAVAWYMPEPPTCLADIEGMNGAVDVFDLIALLEAWGACPEPCPPSCPADITGDSAVDVFDLLELLMAWGACP